MRVYFLFDLTKMKCEARLIAFQQTRKGLKEALACCETETCEAALEALSFLINQRTTPLEIKLKWSIFSENISEKQYHKALFVLSQAFKKSQRGITKLKQAYEIYTKACTKDTEESICYELQDTLQVVIPLFENELQLRKKLIGVLLQMDVTNTLEVQRYECLWQLDFKKSGNCYAPCLANFFRTHPGWWCSWMSRLETRVQSSLQR